MPKENDEYNWTTYTEEYKEQLEGMKREGTQFFITQPIELLDDRIGFKEKLHNNWKDIYSAAYMLKPKSILECGCGGCYNLKNLHTLLPGSKIAGTDLLPSQLDYGKSFADLPFSIIQNLRASDMSGDIGDVHEQYEYVFSHAVVMHLATEKARMFLRNMARLSSKYIFMVEGVLNHENWYEFVKSTLPEFDFQIYGKYVQNSILLTRKPENIQNLPTPALPDENKTLAPLPETRVSSYIVFWQIGNNASSVSRNVVDVLMNDAWSAKEKFEAVKEQLCRVAGKQPNMNITGMCKF